MPILVASQWEVQNAPNDDITKKLLLNEPIVYPELFGLRSGSFRNTMENETVNGLKITAIAKLCLFAKTLVISLQIREEGRFRTVGA